MDAQTRHWWTLLRGIAVLNAALWVVTAATVDLDVAYQAAEEPCRLLQLPALLLAARGRGLQPLAPFLTSFVTLLRAAA